MNRENRAFDVGTWVGALQMYAVAQTISQGFLYALFWSCLIYFVCRTAFRWATKPESEE